MSPKELCLITGGGSGIGRATAIKFASNNIKTIIVGRREEALLETIDLAGKYGDNITPVSYTHLTLPTILLV